MPEQTDNHDWTIPSVGTDPDWGTILNTLFDEDLDTQVPLFGTLSNRPSAGSNAPALYVASDEERFYYNTGSTWKDIGRSLDSVVNVATQSGDTLDEKFNNAVNSLSTGAPSRLLIPAKDDGTAWEWTTDRTVDLVDKGGLQVDVDQTARIEYTGTGTMLEVEASDASGPFDNQDSQFHLAGGYWEATDDADCWLRCRDTFGAEVNPTEVTFNNASGDATGLEIVADEVYNEASRIRGTYRADIGIDFITPTQTGGAGDDSFNDTLIQGVHINAQTIGIRLRGNLAYSSILKPSMFAKADGATCMVLGTSFAKGLSIISAKFEDPSGSNANTTGVETTADYNRAASPLFVQPAFGQLSTNAVFDTANHSMAALYSNFSELEIRDLNGDNIIGFNMFRAEGGEILFKNDDGLIQTSDGSVQLNMGSDGGPKGTLTEHTPSDVRDITLPEKGMRAYHDPSINGDGNTEGPVYYDGSSWVSLVDGSTVS